MRNRLGEIERLTRQLMEFGAAMQAFKEAGMRLASRFGSVDRKVVFLKLLEPVFSEVSLEADRLRAYAEAEIKGYKEVLKKDKEEEETNI